MHGHDLVSRANLAHPPLYLAACAVGRMGMPAEIAPTYVLLASEVNSKGGLSPWLRVATSQAGRGWFVVLGDLLCWRVQVMQAANRPTSGCLLASWVWMAKHFWMGLTHGKLVMHAHHP